MMWSIACGKGETDCESRQYSQRASARCQTCRSRAGSMHHVHAGAFQGEPGPRPEEAEPVSDSSIVLDLVLLGGRERPLLRLEGEVAHPFLVLGAEPEAQELAGGFGRE